MKLRPYAITKIGKMVVGDDAAFPYRSSWYITKFFERCGLDFVHNGTTRSVWAADRLHELNDKPSQHPDLPSEDLTRVLIELFDTDDFNEANAKVPSGFKMFDREVAMSTLNAVLSKDGLAAYFDENGNCHLRSTSNGASTATTLVSTRPLSREEIAQRKAVEMFLDTASEDEFTEKLLVPLFQTLGFRRVVAPGHSEKTLEFGKDLWMKFQLPTGHWIYFGAQVKKTKLDARGDGDSNVATILNQVLMGLGHHIFDPEINKNVLPDHFFIISSRDITRAARHWLGLNLDQSQRRQIIFMDRPELLDLSARVVADLQLSSPPSNSDEVPF